MESKVPLNIERNGGEMERLPRGIYSPELRDQAVRLYQEEQTTLPELVKRLSIPKGTFKNWVTAARSGKLAELGKHQKPLTDIELELAKVKRELAEVKKLMRKFIHALYGNWFSGTKLGHLSKKLKLNIMHVPYFSL